jgi:hypothetical protein
VPPSANSMSPMRRASAPVKAPRSWPKSSALHEGVGDRAAIDGHERRRRPPAALVERPRHEFLAGARLAGDEHVDVAGRHAIDDGIDLPHRRTLAEEALERIGPLDDPPEHLLRVAPPRLVARIRTSASSRSASARAMHRGSRRPRLEAGSRGCRPTGASIDDEEQADRGSALTDRAKQCRRRAWRPTARDGW